MSGLTHQDTGQNDRPYQPSRIRLLPFALLFAAVLIETLLLILLDINFSYEKKELNIIRKRPLESLQLQVSMVHHEMLREMRNPGSLPKEKMEEFVRSAYGDAFRKLSDPDYPAVRLELANSEGVVVFTWQPPNADEKRKRFNTWENCLFSRNFEYAARWSRNLELRIYFVNWPGIPEVSQLLMKYRGFAVVITLGNLLVSLLIYRGAIRPLSRIHHALDIPHGEAPPIIQHPTHTVEHAYNFLARATRLIRTQFALTDLLERGDSAPLFALEENAEFWQPALESIRSGMGFSNCLWIQTKKKGVFSLKEVALDESDLQRLLENITREDIVPPPHSDPDEITFFHYKDGRLHPSTDESTESGFWLCGYVRRRDEYVGALVGVCTDPNPAPATLTPYFRAILNHLGFLLTRSLERQEELDRGRFEVSVDLSASMGHDLTNILATGKLELETLRTAWKRGILSVPEEKRTTVESALEGLRKTTALLQEVVNVYRAFSYTREPLFEQVELNGLVSEVIELYRHSTSRPVRYVLRESPFQVTAQVDPRLLKLVLFNLLANATQSIGERLKENPDPPGEVAVWCFEESGWAVIRVEDNGTGFRDPRGQRLDGIDLQQIFQFDFTTKKKQGGLGLAWVRSIVEDVHRGHLTPFNRETGGAVMDVHLPTLAHTSYSSTIHQESL